MSQVVIDVDGEPTFPREIPSKRKDRDIKYQILVILSCVCCGCYFARTEIYVYIYRSTSFCFLFFTFVQLLLRCLLLIEERHHLFSRYRGSWGKLLLAAFSFNIYSIISIIISFFSIPIYGFSMKDINDELGTYLLPLIAMYLYQGIIKLEQCPMNMGRQLDKSEGVDYGSGMAHSYYYGYLKILLPSKGDERKGLIETINQFEDCEGDIHFPIKKLFILIPMSGTSPPKVTEDSKILEYGKNLESRIMDRAGTFERVYKSSAYKLYRNEKEKPLYVCTEYATPLKTLNEVMEHTNTVSNVCKSHYTELVTNFYMSLRNIIEDNKISHLCELIYYKDLDKNGKKIKNLDVGKLILERIDMLSR